MGFLRVDVHWLKLCFIINRRGSIASEARYRELNSLLAKMQKLDHCVTEQPGQKPWFLCRSVERRALVSLIFKVRQLQCGLCMYHHGMSVLFDMHGHLNIPLDLFLHFPFVSDDIMIYPEKMDCNTTASRSPCISSNDISSLKLPMRLPKVDGQ